MNALARILTLVEPLGIPLVRDEADLRTRLGIAGTELAAILTKQNGFYAFDRALLVRPWSNRAAPLGLVEWNAQALWTSAYECDISRCTFFAEDVFGTQFALRDSEVVQFDPETAAITTICNTVSAWIESVLDRDLDLAGAAFAQAWTKGHGPIPRGYRLIPRTPFVLGGEFSVDNLTAAEEVDGMRIRADVANGIQGLEEGDEVEFRLRR